MEKEILELDGKQNEKTRCHFAQKYGITTAVALSFLLSSTGCNDIIAVSSGVSLNPNTVPLAEFEPTLKFNSEKSSEDNFYDLIKIVSRGPVKSEIHIEEDFVDEDIEIDEGEETETTDDGIFESEILDISQWEDMNMQVEKVERKEEVVEVIEPTTLYSVIIGENALIQKGQYGHLEISTISEGTAVPILGRKELVGTNGETIVLGILPYSGKFTKIEAVLLEAKDSDGTMKNFVTNSKDWDYSQVPSIESGETQRLLMDNSETLELARYIYDFTDLTIVKEEVMNDEIIQNVLEFKEVLEQYDEDTSNLYEYLRGTDWYEGMVEKVGEETMKEVLAMSGMQQYAGQPIQCVIWDRMARSLYPELNIAVVKTANSPEGYARGMVREQVLALTEILSSSVGYEGAIQLFSTNIPVENYEPGDLFVTATERSLYGHTGVILKKGYYDNGKPFLIVSDSNRGNDGLVRVFVVDEFNIGKIFGSEKMFIVRKN